MNASKFLIPTAAAFAFAGIIGIANAQSGTAAAPDNRSNETTNPDTRGTMNRNSTGTMNRDATGTTNRTPPGNMNRDSAGTTNRDSTGTTNRSSTGERSNERMARADRN